MRNTVIKLNIINIEENISFCFHVDINKTTTILSQYLIITQV